MVLNKEVFEDLSLYELIQNIVLYLGYEEDELMLEYLGWNLDLPLPCGQIIV